MADVLALRVPAPSLQEAVDAFLAGPELADTSRRSYAQTTGRLLRTFGGDQLPGELAPGAVAATQHGPARRCQTPADWGTV